MIWHQIRFWSNPCRGEVRQPGGLGLPDPVLAAGPATMPELELLEGAASGVGRERGEPVAVDVIEAELRSGVGPFPADDHPHPLGPAGQVQQPGELGQIGAVAGVTIRVVGREPHPFGNLVVERCGVHGEGEPDRVRDPAPGQPFRELLRASGAVRADQRPASGPRIAVGELRQRCPGHGDVIRSLVGAGVARPQMHRECFAGSVRAVVGERQQRVEPEPASSSSAQRVVSPSAR